MQKERKNADPQTLIDRTALLSPSTFPAGAG